MNLYVDVLCGECGEDVEVEVIMVDDQVADIYVVDEVCDHYKDFTSLLVQVEESVHGNVQAENMWADFYGTPAHD